MFDSPGNNEEDRGEGSVATVPNSVRFDRLPGDLAEIRPGPRLGSALASIDRDRLNGADRVTLMQAWNRQVAHAQAELYASMTAVADAEAEVFPDDDPFNLNDAAASEIRAALTLTRRSADYHLGFAQQLVEAYPEVWKALHRGEVDLPKARVIINQTSHLDRGIADEVAHLALELAHRQTTGQLRARLQRLVIAVDPFSARERYEERLVERRVVIEATDAGTANLLGLDLPVAITNAAMRRINRLARAANTTDDPRTMDQIRADVFLDLLYGRDLKGSADRGVIDVRVDLATLAELNDSPAEIPGWGPVIADIARQIVTEQDDAQWRVTVTDPATGQALHNGTTRRRPTARQRRRVETQHLACVFPGCRMPARESDLDHRRAWFDSGPTEEENLQPLCRHDHLLKHNGWRVRMLRPGVFLWTSPLGLIYIVESLPP
jgi:hypothetical protein